MQVVLGFRPGLDEHGEPLPQGPIFLRWMPILYLWMPILSNLATFFSRLLYKYPAEMRDQVEADLIERRRLAEEAKAKLEDEKESMEV